MEIQVRINHLYPYKNLRLYVESQLGNYMRTDTADFVLSNTNNGSLSGDGWGSLFLYRKALPTLPCQDSLPQFKVRITHGMQDEALPGIKNIGLRIRESYE